MAGQKRKRKQRKAAFPAQSILATALLLIFFPVGLLNMWFNRDLEWKNSIKTALSCLCVAVFTLIVILIPSGTPKVDGGIRMVGPERAAEVYGPTLPAEYTGSYIPVSSSDSGVLYAGENVEQDEKIHVYAAEGSEYYHDYNCRYAYASSHRYTLYEADFYGYKPCKLCNPPLYDGTN